MADTGNETEGQEPDVTDADDASTTEATDVDNTADDAEQQGADDNSSEEKSEAPDKWEGIPEDHWVRAELEAVRREAAARRTENKALKEQLAGAKTAEEVQQIVNEYTEKLTEADLRSARISAGRDFGLPNEIANRLEGSTEEEILADAQRLAPLFTKGPRTPAPLTPSGGRDPREGSDEPSPEELYAKTQAGKRRRF